MADNDKDKYNQALDLIAHTLSMIEVHLSQVVAVLRKIADAQGRSK
jgi:hypothetical protein